MFDGALFDEYKNFAFKFPEPQYLGAKANLLPWIARFMPDNVETALDAFAGFQSVSYYFKQLVYKTQSWKMKRPFEQIEPAIINYLDGFSKAFLSRIDFTFKDKAYSSLAGVIFVVK